LRTHRHATKKAIAGPARDAHRGHTYHAHDLRVAGEKHHASLGVGWQSDIICVVEQKANGKPRITMIANAETRAGGNRLSLTGDTAYVKSQTTFGARR
jgi:hypothetical protein